MNKKTLQKGVIRTVSDYIENIMSVMNKQLLPSVGNAITKSHDTLQKWLRE